MKENSQSSPVLLSSLARKLLFCIVALLVATSAAHFIKIVHSAWKSEELSDVTRLWRAAKYVEHGIDPWRLSVDLLESTFGKISGPERVRLADVKIFAISQTDTSRYQDRIVPGIPPGESTYPPWTIGLLYPLFTHVSDVAADKIFLVVNVTALLIFCVAVYRFSLAKGKLVAAQIAVLPFIWPATHYGILRGQLSLLILCALWAYAFWQPRRPVGGAMLLTVFLLKPSLGLPFFILPLIRKRWLELGLVAAFVAVLTLPVMFRLPSDFFSVLVAWKTLGGYFLNGIYTFQEIYNRLGVENTIVCFLFQLMFLAATTLWCYREREQSDAVLLAVLCFPALLWMYHDIYDFTVLLFPLVVLLLETKRWSVTFALELGAYILIGLALGEYVTTGTNLLALMGRWGGRLSICLLFVLTFCSSAPRRFSFE